jgi:hypothetical protein
MLFIGGAPAPVEQIFVHGEIRSGHSAEQKKNMIEAMMRAVATAANTSAFYVWIYLVDLVAAQMTEFGDVLPEPGAEEKWLSSLTAEDRQRMLGVRGLKGAI